MSTLPLNLSGCHRHFYAIHSQSKNFINHPPLSNFQPVQVSYPHFLRPSVSRNTKLLLENQIIFRNPSKR